MSTRFKIIAIIYFLWLVGIVVLANKKGTAHFLGFGAGIPYFDKVAHFFLMGVLSFLVNLAFDVRSVGSGFVKYLIGSILVLVIVSAEELSQIFVRGRAFDPWDLVADFAGVLIFGELARLVYNRFVVR